MLGHWSHTIQVHWRLRPRYSSFVTRCRVYVESRSQTYTDYQLIQNSVCIFHHGIFHRPSAPPASTAPIAASTCAIRRPRSSPVSSTRKGTPTSASLPPAFSYLCPFDESTMDLNPARSSSTARGSASASLPSPAPAPSPPLSSSVLLSAPLLLLPWSYRLAVVTPTLHRRPAAVGCHTERVASMARACNGIGCDKVRYRQVIYA